MSRLPLPSALIGLLMMTGVAAPMPADAADNACRAGHDDRVERPAPDALLVRLGRTFGVAPDTLRGSSSVRCAGGRLIGCMVGANLNCGRANLARTSAGGDAFCHDSPGADSVPLAATGHDTIYDWRCEGTRAVAGKVVAPVDRFGFMAPNWRAVR